MSYQLRFGKRCCGHKGINSAGKDVGAAAGFMFSCARAQRGTMRVVDSLRLEETSQVIVSNHQPSAGGNGWNRGVCWSSGRAPKGSTVTLSAGPSAAELTPAPRDTWRKGGDVGWQLALLHGLPTMRGAE